MSQLIDTIRADLPNYSDDELKVLIGRLALNMYGADVSEALADAVLAERNKRKAKARMEREQADADAWMAEHAHLLGDVDAEGDSRNLEYGAEYFDTDNLDADYDDMDYYERMGIKAVSEAKRTVYVDTGAKGESPRQPRDTGHNDGHYRPLVPMTAPVSRVATETLPYRGQPVTHYSPSCKRASGRAQHITEQKALKDMSQADAKKVRRYAKKHQVTISTAIDSLRAAGKID